MTAPPDAIASTPPAWLHPELRLIGRICAASLIAVIVIAAAVRVTVASQARHLLAYPFPRDSLGWPGFAQVLGKNARLALAPLAAAYLLELVRPVHGHGWSGWPLRVRAVCDGALALVAFANLFVAGASYGAYGLKMARYTLPYAPGELVGFACPLALYLEARRRGPTRQQVVALTGAGVGLLVISALLECLLPPL